MFPQQEVERVELYAAGACIKRLEVGESIEWILVVSQPDGALHVIWRVGCVSYGLLHKGPYLAEWQIEEAAAG